MSGRILHKLLCSFGITTSKNVQQKGVSSVYELQRGLGYIKRRKEGKEAVIRYPRFNRLKHSDDFHLSLLQLYMPNRTPIETPHGLRTLKGTFSVQCSENEPF